MKKPEETSLFKPEISIRAIILLIKLNKNEFVFITDMFIVDIVTWPTFLPFATLCLNCLQRRKKSTF